MLPESLARYANAITFVSAIPCADTADWRPHGHPTGLHVPFANGQHHPTVAKWLNDSRSDAGVHWDGVVPQYRWIRLDLQHPTVAPFAPSIRRAAAHLRGSDDAIYAFSFVHKSIHRCERDALSLIVSLFVDDTQCGSLPDS